MTEQKIADIYLRTTTPRGTGLGLRRQERVCRNWCTANKVVVRNVITDHATAFPDFKKQKNLLAVYNQYRKAHWEKRGEPLDARECEPSVVPLDPPNFLVYETASIFSRAQVQEALGFMMFFRMIGVDLVWAREDHIVTQMMSGITITKNGVQLPDGTFVLSPIGMTET